MAGRNLADISRTLDARNDGEELLVEISNALNAGEQPSKASIQKLSKAVDAMLSEKDPQQRLYLLQLRLGFLKAGRPLIEKNTKKQEQGKRIAEVYWWHWLSGCKKEEARVMVAGELGDGKGFPCSDTVKNNVERYPQLARRVFFAWLKLSTPSDAEIKRARDGIKVFLEEHPEKTP